MKQNFGFVLYLSASDNDILRPIITHLQQKYCNQSPFEPHLSLSFSLAKITLPDVIKTVTNATQHITSFVVEADGFGFDDKWSRALYIKIKPNPRLDEIRTNLNKEIDPNNNSPFTPHISLIYKDALSPKERNKIIASLSLPPTFTIQGIQVLSPGANNNDWRDYTKWQVMHTIDFSQQYNPPNTNHISTSINRHQL